MKWWSHKFSLTSVRKSGITFQGSWIFFPYRYFSDPILLLSVTYVLSFSATFFQILHRWQGTSLYLRDLYGQNLRTLASAITLSAMWKNMKKTKISLCWLLRLLEVVIWLFGLAKLWTLDDTLGVCVNNLLSQMCHEDVNNGIWR